MKIKKVIKAVKTPKKPLKPIMDNSCHSWNDLFIERVVMGWPTTSQGMGQLGEGLDIGFTPSIGCITHEDMLSMIWWKLFVVCQIYFQLFGLSRVASSFFSERR